MLDLLLGPRSRTEGLDAVLRRFERLVGSGHRPYLAGLMRVQRAELDDLLVEALRRAGTTRIRPRCAGSSPWSTARSSPP